MNYRLALDLGTTSVGWAVFRLGNTTPVSVQALIKAGVRIFSDGRNPKDGSSLAVSRREARAMRRRRDRLLKRKNRMMQGLISHGFFPADAAQRLALTRLDPYELRAKGLDAALSAAEFARALFHINQRRGFKSNRKTDKKDSDAGALKTAIGKLRGELSQQAGDGKPRTVGEYLWLRQQSGQTVRARFRQQRVETASGKSRIDKSYDLYIERAMIEAEFDALWAKQQSLNPELFCEQARLELKDCLLHQRPLKPVKPGRCTLLPDYERAARALPSQQRFRILQEVNNLRLVTAGLQEQPLTLVQRNVLAQELEKKAKLTFSAMRKLLKLPSTSAFSVEDERRTDLKGNETAARLSKGDMFGAAWHNFDAQLQDDIVERLLHEETEGSLVAWLQHRTGVDEPTAQALTEVSLPEGYGSLSRQALQRIVPALEADVVTYDKAVIAAGFEHHSDIAHAATGEILDELPYYGEYMQRHVGFGSGLPTDPAEKRFGKIANPTVHIGLNQIRKVVNALIKRYGHPAEVVIEVARDLKLSQERKRELLSKQTDNQNRNARLRAQAASLLGCDESRVRKADIHKLQLWEELSFDVANRRCPYSGQQISAAMVLTDDVEIEHILPFSQTLDDSSNNKTVALRQANRIKGNRTPWQAREDFAAQGWDYDGIEQRALTMPKGKRYRFAQDGIEQWLRDDKGFLARALNDTSYLSRVAKEYLSLVCPGGTRAMPGRMTAMLRAKFGLNNILGINGEKNRNDHRHHAVDACVIGVTDQAMLQRFSRASASAREQHLNRLVEDMPMPWPTYREQVARAVAHIHVSHRPDHGYEGRMHNDTAYGLLGGGMVHVHKKADGVRVDNVEKLSVIEFAEPKQLARHGVNADGSARAYKGYKGDSNYCMDIIRTEKDGWKHEVVSTFEAYQIVKEKGEKFLHQTGKSLVTGSPLVMRLIRGDCLKLESDDLGGVYKVVTLKTNGAVLLAPLNEANVDARNRDPHDEFKYLQKTASVLRKLRARRVSISPIGEIHDPGFRA